MGAPKQKWTDAEENALKSGIEKYGPGKWRAIQKDPKYGPLLTQRSNVDLKDKWRNMSLNVAGVTTPREPAKSEKWKTVALSVGASPAPKEKGGKSSGRNSASPQKADADGKAGKKSSILKYQEWVISALVALHEPEGASAAAIAKYIEEKEAVPANFRRILNVRLKALVEERKLSKVKQHYILVEGGRKGRKREDTTVAIAKDADKVAQLVKARQDVEQAKTKMKTAEEAAKAAAQAVEEAEAAALAAEQAAKEAALAEQEAAAAEAAAEAAAAAIRPPKKRAVREKAGTSK